MWKSASLAVLVGASAASLGTVWVMRQMKKSRDNAAYAQAMDEVLSQSDLLRRQESDGVREEIEKHLNKRKSNKIFEQDSGNEQPEQQNDEPHPLSKSLKNFEEVVNSRVKVRDNSNNKNGQKKKKSTKEFSEFISKELQETAGINAPICMQKLDDAAYVCIDCLADQLNNIHNNHKTLSTEGDRSDNEEENPPKYNQIIQKNHLSCQIDQNKTTDSNLGVNIKQINRFATPIELTELLCRDCVKQLHKGHLAFNIFAKGGEDKFIRNHHKNSENNFKIPGTTSCIPKDEISFKNPTRKVTDREILIYGAVALAQEAGEILKMERNSLNMFCSSYGQINLLEEDIPEEIQTHLCQELNLIFDALLERVQKAESEELNALLRILLKRVQEIMGENNILIFIIGGILVKRNILDRILGADCLDGKNQNRLAEILLKIAKTDEQLRLQLSGLLLQHFKTVFISQSLTSLLVFLLKHPTLRANLPSILKKSSHFIAPLFNAKSILEKHELSKHKNKILRCFIIMRILCQDQSLVIEGIIQNNYLKFTQAIADVAQLIENHSELDIRTNFLKNIIHTNLSQELLFLKELDFHVRLLFAQFAILAKNAQHKEKIMVSHKLQAYLMQNIHHLNSEKQQGNMKNSNKNHQNASHNQNHKDQTDSINTNQVNLKGSSLIRVNLTSLNLLTILEKTLGVSTKEINFGEKAQAICRDYLFYISEGHELLQLEGVSHIINFPENRLMLEKLLFIYGLRCIGDFPLLVSLQQSGVAAEAGATSFISEVFSETQSGCFDVYQNLRFLFTDACNQTTQLAINIFQVNARQLPLHQLFREILKYTSIHDAQDIISLCEVVKQSSGQIILDPIVRLKEEYNGSFYPLLFSKYPILFDRLIQEQDMYFKSTNNKKNKQQQQQQQQSTNLNQIQQSNELLDSDSLSKETNHIFNKKQHKSFQSASASSIEQYITLGSSGILSSAGSSDFAYLNSSRLMEKFRVVTANNFSSRKNCNDIFGSDYDLFIVKDRLAAFHGRIAQKMNVAIRAFFLLDKNSTLSSHLTLIIQIYLRVLLFQIELLDKSSEKTSNNFLSSDLISKACSALAGHLNSYLLEDLQFVSSSQQQQLEEQQQSQKSQSPLLRKYKSYFK